jgi:hypothetical protein
MDFAKPSELSQDIDRFKDFIRINLTPNLSTWTREKKIPAAFFQIMGKGGWYGFRIENGRLVKGSALREAVISEELAKTSPGVAIAALAHIDLGLMGLTLFMQKLSPLGFCCKRPAGKLIRERTFVRHHPSRNTWPWSSPEKSPSGRQISLVLHRLSMNIQFTNIHWTFGGHHWGKAPRMYKN